jgi:hypothetical protein
MPFTEDLTAFFQTADFAYAATWTPVAGGGPYTVNVIFDNANFDSNIGSAGATGLQPMCLAADDQLAQGSGIKRNDALVINGVTYKVANIDPDGSGVTNLTLRT